MTSATEELRRLLDERGVKYERPEDGTTIYYDSGGNRYTYNVNPDSGWAQLFGYNLTPEQAIAATLGNGVERTRTEYAALTAGQVREAWTGNLKRDCLYDPPMPDWHAIADELNATLGGGTCHMNLIDEYERASGEEEYLCECSECGSQEWEPAHDLPLYCRKCGRKVEQ